ncbi:MAG: aminoacyl-tRNA hydrolase [Spirochaetota bacterium]
MNSRSILVLCLGNPGRSYEKTRHNAGFFVADYLEDRLGVRFRRRLFSRYSVARYDCLILVKPLTYMNRSGDVIEPVCARLGIEDYTLVVVFDQMDLPPGSIRLKRGGSDGGHRGLRSIFQHAGTVDVWKLAVGVGRPSPGESVVDHVLSVPDESSRALIETAVAAAAHTITALCTKRPEELMNEVNRRS